MDGIETVVKQLEKQRAAIEKALEALRGLDGMPELAQKRGPGRPPKSAATVEPAKPASRKRGISVAGRKRLAEAMRKRWALKRSAAQVKKRGTAKKTA